MDVHRLQGCREPVVPSTVASGVKIPRSFPSLLPVRACHSQFSVLCRHLSETPSLYPGGPIPTHPLRRRPQSLLLLPSRRVALVPRCAWPGSEPLLIYAWSCSQMGRGAYRANGCVHKHHDQNADGAEQKLRDRLVQATNWSGLEIAGHQGSLRLVCRLDGPGDLEPAPTTLCTKPEQWHAPPLERDRV
jgi:hypothetical protein